MQDIIEALQQKSITQMINSELPNEDDLVLIEEEILLPIPHCLKEFLLNTSNLVVGSLEPVTAGDTQLHTFLPEVTTQAWSEGLSRELLPLCKVGSNYYVVNQYGAVQFWQNGETTEQEWDDVWHWAKDVWLSS